MTVEVTAPSQDVVYVTKDGRLTLEGLRLLIQIIAKLEDHETRLLAAGH